MRPFLARFSEPVWSGHLASWADFITTTPELEFSVNTGGDIGAAVIADRAQHSGHQFVERGFVRQVLDIEDRTVVAIRVAATDQDHTVSEAPPWLAYGARLRRTA